MQCGDAQSRMEEAFLTAPDAPMPPDLRAHLEECPAGRLQTEDLHSLRDELRQRESLPPASPEWLGNLRHRLQREKRAHRGIRFLPAAAAALLVFFVGFLALPGGDPFPAPHPLGHFGDAFSRAASPADDIATDDRNLYLPDRLSDKPGITALDADTGAIRWRSPVGEIGHLHAEAGLLFGLTASDDGKRTLVALDSQTGNLEWEIDASSPSLLSPPDHPIAGDHARVYWADGPTLRCHDLRTGAPIWSRTFRKQGVVSGPVLHGVGLVVSTGKRLYRIDRKTGKTTDRLNHQGQSESGFPLLTLHGDTAYCLRPRKSFHSTLTCIDLDQWRIRWNRVTDRALSLLATREAVVLRRQSLAAFDPATGRPLWEREAKGCGPLTVMAHSLWFVDTRETGSLIALRPRSGETSWKEDGILSCDAFRQSGDRGYVKTQEGRILAWTLSTP